jgi:hypothetical protein
VHQVQQQDEQVNAAAQHLVPGRLRVSSLQTCACLQISWAAVPWLTMFSGCEEGSGQKKKKKKRGYMVCSSSYAATDTS